MTAQVGQGSRRQDNSTMHYAENMDADRRTA